MALSDALSEYKQKIAEIFDARIDYHRSELHARMADRLVQLAAPQPRESVLDIATGTGFVAIPIAHLVGAGGKVVGVDISAGMLAQAKHAVSAAGLSNIELEQVDAENLDYAPKSFDLVICCNALPYMSDIPAALRHWHSLLRPGGRLAFNCWAEHSYPMAHLVRVVAARHGIRIAVAGQDIGTPERCCAVLTAAGFYRPEVVIEPTGNFFSSDQLAAVFTAVVKNPLYGLTPSDARQLNNLRDEYMEEARSPSVQKSLNDEIGAYFVLAHKRKI